MGGDAVRGRVAASVSGGRLRRYEASQPSAFRSTTSWTDLPVTASKSNAARPVSSWASWACIPVCLMTLIPYCVFFVLESPSISSTHEQRMSHFRDAMSYAGLAVVLALVIWRRASPICRAILGLCVPTNLYTLFVASGQALHAAMGR